MAEGKETSEDAALVAEKKKEEERTAPKSFPGWKTFFASDWIWQEFG